MVLINATLSEKWAEAVVVPAQIIVEWCWVVAFVCVAWSQARNRQFGLRCFLPSALALGAFPVAFLVTAMGLGLALAHFFGR